MLDKTEIDQKVAVRSNGSVVLGKIIKLYGQENPYQSGQFARINVATPHGSIIRTGIAWCTDPTPEELLQIEEYEKDAEEKGQLYDFNPEHNTEGND